MLSLFMSVFLAFPGASSPPSSSVSRARFLDVSGAASEVAFSDGASGRVSSEGAAALVSVAVVSAGVSAGGWDVEVGPGFSEASGTEVPILGTWLLR